MATKRKFRWVVEFTVDRVWVEDGFNLTDDRALQMLENDLQQAYGYELGARVIEAPDQKEIAKAQGYTS